jgi:hypothetical protein
LILTPEQAAKNKKHEKRIDPVFAHIADGEICLTPLGSKE